INDVLVRDLEANTITLVSRASGVNGVRGNSTSLDAALSADGRFVALASAASNLDPADGDSTLDVFVRDDFDVRVRISERSGLRYARLFLDGDRKLSMTRKTFTALIRDSRLRLGAHRIAVTASDVVGNGTGRTLRFRRCLTPPPRRTSR